MNAKNIGVLIRLLYMTPDYANDIFVVLHISKQAKWAKKREVWPIQDVECHLGRGLCQRSLFIHYTFTYLMDMIREFVLVECQVINNLILGECAHTFTDVNSTRKDVVEADLVMKFLTDGNAINN